MINGGMIGADRNMNQKGSLFLSSFEYESHLGSGGFGDVFAATRARDRLPVAIKFIKKDTVSSWGKVIYQLFQTYQKMTR